MSLVQPERYVSIRRALDTSLTAADLPDEVIEEDIYLGEAERTVAGLFTVAISDSNRARAINAAVYMTAALLAHAIPQIVAEKDATGESVTLKGYDPVKKEAQMRARANEMIALVNEEPVSLVQPATSAVRQMTSCISVICPTHHVSRRSCGCAGATLVF